MSYPLGFAEPTRHRQSVPHDTLFTLPVGLVRIMEYEGEADRRENARRVVCRFGFSEHTRPATRWLADSRPRTTRELHDKQLERLLGVPARPRPFESSAVVRQIGEHPTPHSPLGLGVPIGLGQEEVAVAPTDRVVFPREAQPFIGVVAKGLQQAVANALGAIVDDYEGLVHESTQDVKADDAGSGSDPAGLVVAHRGDGSIDVESAGEYSESAESRLLHR